MDPTVILLPVFALAIWTALVLLVLPYVRIGAVVRRELAVDDFKFGESPAVPGSVSVPNRNYMNLLEMPVLFYVVSLMLYSTSAVTPLAVGLAWAFVALRIVHSGVHLTYNKVTHRLLVFSLSNVALVALWVVAGIQMFAQ